LRDSSGSASPGRPFSIIDIECRICAAAFAIRALAPAAILGVGLMLTVSPSENQFLKNGRAKNENKKIRQNASSRSRLPDGRKKIGAAQMQIVKNVIYRGAGAANCRIRCLPDHRACGLRQSRRAQARRWFTSDATSGRR
jgi:hypothetical protein